MTYQKIWFLTCLTQDIMHFVPLRILKAMRRILGAISKVSNRLGWMLPDVFCTSEFQRILEQNTEEERAEEFYRYWVLKESFMKATRLGMKLGLDQFEIAFSKEGNPYLIKQPEEFPQKYYFKEYEVADIPCKIAVNFQTR